MLAVSLVVVVFLPITLLGLIVPVNDYEAQGISAVDCDGPLEIMLLIGPSLVVYAAGAIYYAVRLKRVRKSVLTGVLLVLCTLMVLAAGGKTWAAYREKNKPQHQETCGDGW